MDDENYAAGRDVVVPAVKPDIMDQQTFSRVVMPNGRSYTTDPYKRAPGLRGMITSSKEKAINTYTQWANGTKKQNAYRFNNIRKSFDKYESALESYELYLTALGEYNGHIKWANDKYFPKYLQDWEKDASNIRKEYATEWGAVQTDFETYLDSITSDNNTSGDEDSALTQTTRRIQPAHIRMDTAPTDPKLDINSSLEDYKKWRREWEGFSELQQLDSIDHKKQRIYLYKCITPELQDHLDFAVRNGRSLQEYLTAIEARITRRNPISIDRRLFFQLEQAPGEEDRSFLNRLRSHARRCDLANIEEEDLIKIVCQWGLRNEKLVEKLVNLDPDCSLDEYGDAIDSFGATTSVIRSKRQSKTIDHRDTELQHLYNSTHLTAEGLDILKRMPTEDLQVLTSYATIKKSGYQMGAKDSFDRQGKDFTPRSKPHSGLSTGKNHTQHKPRKILCTWKLEDGNICEFPIFFECPLHRINRNSAKYTFLKKTNEYRQAQDQVKTNKKWQDMLMCNMVAESKHIDNSPPEEEEDPIFSHINTMSGHEDKPEVNFKFADYESYPITCGIDDIESGSPFHLLEGLINQVYPHPSLKQEGCSKPPDHTKYDIGVRRVNPKLSSSIPLMELPISDTNGKKGSTFTMFDSGASHSVISYELVKRLGLKIDHPNWNTTLRDASGRSMSCCGSMELTINYFGDRIRIRAIVTSGLRKELLFIGWREMQCLNMLPWSWPLPPNITYTRNNPPRFQYVEEGQEPRRSAGEKLNEFKQYAASRTLTNMKDRKGPIVQELHGYQDTENTPESKKTGLTEILKIRADHQGILNDQTWDRVKPTTEIYTKPTTEVHTKSTTQQLENSTEKPLTEDEQTALDNHVVYDFNLMISEDNNLHHRINKLSEKYPDIFDGSAGEAKKMKGPPHRIITRPYDHKQIYSAKTPRSIPFAYRDLAGAEIRKYLEKGYIEEVPLGEEGPWIHHGFLVPKPPNPNDPDAVRVRLVVDLSHLNSFVIRPVNNFRSALSLIKSIPPNANYFCKMDMAKAYFQVEVHPDDRHLLQFLFEGQPLMRFKRFPMGLSSSGDIWCKKSDQAIAGLKNTVKLVDDVLMWGETEDELLGIVESFFDRCHDHGLTLDKMKHESGQKISFGGYILTNEGYAPHPDKTRALKAFSGISKLSDVRSLSGLVVPFAKNCPELSSYMRDIHSVLRKKKIIKDGKVTKLELPKKIKMTPELMRALDETIRYISEVGGTLLKPYHPNQEFIVYTDASKLHGISYAAIQMIKNKDGKVVPNLIECDSRNLIPAEKNYSITELELLAVCWALKKLSLYTEGRLTHVRTDHMPLVDLCKKSMAIIENRRIQNMLYSISHLSIHVAYIEGKMNRVADALSRRPCYRDEKEIIEENRELGLHHIEDDTKIDIPIYIEDEVHLTCKEFKTLANKDKCYQSLLLEFRKGTPAKKLVDKQFCGIWNEIYVDNGLLLFNNRLIVPESMTWWVLKRLHMQHLGVERTTKLTQQLFYFQKISQLVKDTVMNCPMCERYKAFPQKEPIIQEYALRPMQIVTCDIFDCLGKKFMVMCDKYSNFPWVATIKSASTAQVISNFAKWFELFGYPDKLRTDGATCFTSEDFSTYCQERGISHRMSSAHFHSSNGHAEKAVQSMKNLFKKCNGSLSQFWERLQKWRATPNTGSVFSPFQWMFGGRRKCGIPMIEAHLKRITAEEWQAAEKRRLETFQIQKLKYNKRARPLTPLSLGDKVRIYEERPGYERGFLYDGTVVEVNRDDIERSYVVKTEDGSMFKRNRRQLLPKTKRPDPTIPPETKHPDPIIPPWTGAISKRSGNGNTNTKWGVGERTMRRSKRIQEREDVCRHINISKI